jgi:hypothetical protein
MGPALALLTDQAEQPANAPQLDGDDRVLARQSCSCFGAYLSVGSGLGAVLSQTSNNVMPSSAPNRTAPTAIQNAVVQKKQTTL